MTSLTWGGGTSLSSSEAERKLQDLHYRKVNGIDELQTVIQTYAKLSNNDEQKHVLMQTAKELNSLPAEKRKILDKLVRGSWLPDPIIYSMLPPKGAEGFAFLTSDSTVFKVLSFRGYSPDEIDFFERDKVPAAFTLLHEARHLYPELPDGTTKIFSWTADPSNAAQTQIDSTSTEYTIDAAKKISPWLTAQTSRIDLLNTLLNPSVQTKFTPSVFAGEVKADSFAALMAAADQSQFEQISRSVAETRRQAFVKGDLNHLSSDALVNSSYVPLKNLAQAIETTNQIAENATINMINQHPELSPLASNAFNLCKLTEYRKNVLTKKDDVDCINTALHIANNPFLPK